MAFFDLIGSSFDNLAQQKLQFANLDTQVQSANLARQAEAQRAVNNWLAQASQLRQQSMDRDAAAQQRADEAAAATAATERDYAFRKGEQAAQIAAEDRRTKAQEKKADDQLQAQKDIISANSKARTEQATQDILDAGQNFASQYPASKRNFESTQAQYHALEIEKEKLQTQNEELAKSGGKKFFGGTRPPTEEAAQSIAENSKRLKEIDRLLGERGQATKAFDAAEKNHNKLLDQMKGYQFIPDDEGGFIFHGPTKQQFPFNTGQAVTPSAAMPNVPSFFGRPAVGAAPIPQTDSTGTGETISPPSPPPPGRFLRARDASVGPQAVPTVAPQPAPPPPGTSNSIPTRVFVRDPATGKLVLANQGG